MYKTLILLLVVLVYNASEQVRIYGQITNLHNTEGLKHGTWKETSPDKDFEYLILNYLDGIRSGKFTAHYANDTIGISGYFKNDKLDGAHQTFDKKGNLIMITNYVDGKENGIRETYSPLGYRLSKSEIVNNDYNGASMDYYQDGNIQIESTYLDGVLNGLYIMYHENGCPSLIGKYLDGEKIGIWLTLDSSGKLLNNVKY